LNELVEAEEGAEIISPQVSINNASGIALEVSSIEDRINSSNKLLDESFRERLEYENSKGKAEGLSSTLPDVFFSDQEIKIKNLESDINSSVVINDRQNIPPSINYSGRFSRLPEPEWDLSGASMKEEVGGVYSGPPSSPPNPSPLGQDSPKEIQISSNERNLAQNKMAQDEISLVTNPSDNANIVPGNSQSSSEYGGGSEASSPRESKLIEGLQVDDLEPQLEIRVNKQRTLSKIQPDNAPLSNPPLARMPSLRKIFFRERKEENQQESSLVFMKKSKPVLYTDNIFKRFYNWSINMNVYNMFNMDRI
jgi:hypothetical protein